MFAEQLGRCSASALLLAILIMVASYLPFGHGLRQPMKHREPKPRDQRFWYRWSRVCSVIRGLRSRGATIVLLLLALPLLSIRSGSPTPAC